MPQLTVGERDDSGRLVASYTIAGSLAKKESSSSETVGVRLRRRSWRHVLSTVFLPAGYPATVSPGKQYSIYNALQAFCSSLAGLIASRAVLQGHGVGKADASATHAILLTVIQDVFSRLTTIVAGYHLGTSLFPEAKTYRLAADIFNDASIIFDTISPHLGFLELTFTYPFVRYGTGSSLRIASLCMSGAFRAMCGVVAGGSKTALTVHFATSGRISGDVGDLNAKDGSKETVLALLGMLGGTLVMHYVHDTASTYIVLFTLLFLHIWANYRAVRVVTLRTLNRQRANIMWTAYRPKTSGNIADQSGKPRILTPGAVSALEYIFVNPAALHDLSARSTPLLGHCDIGSSFSAITSSASAILAADTLRPGHNGLRAPDASQIEAILEFFQDEKYILWFDPHARGACRMHVCLKEGHKPADHLKAWAHAQEVGRILDGRAPGSFDTGGESFSAFLEGVLAAGWKVDEGGMVAGSPRVLSVGNGETGLGDEIDEDRKNV
ncbi:vitamin B6 photo-protection and homoeostasis-domain-containing protein [Fomitopsis serialis]|uniref:vitamin B6 photo-protection and homoeostasis-domain-containing protein n=1 Tax=Fomitopsis serialis TaxID=139415 RepID=UPI0020074BE5|nr:vitamin B6 photo-protection and homoeostasis-domain-containing protein [Neoantrodia serialis]KAH9932265.1 vitamin B6 photo-protection and homoeostasis-domain-containing protein [Neoantrodia serialis]